MNVNQLDHRKTALLFFDMLNVYYHGASETTKEHMRPVVANAVRLRETARKAGIPIMFAQANHRPDGATTGRIITDTDMRIRPWPDGECTISTPAAKGGSWEAEVIPELKPEAEDYFILKYRWSSFHQTYLDLALRTRGIDTLIISGGATEIGIVSTAFSARDMDYSVIIVRDACSGQNIEAHNMLMDLVFPRMARIRSTEQVLGMIKNKENSP